MRGPSECVKQMLIKPFKIFVFRDRCRTTNNMLGDAYGAAIVEALSKKELDAMDKEKENERRKEMENDIEGGHETIIKDTKKVNCYLVG